MTVNIQLQQQITPELSLYAYNDIPVLHLQHAVGSAKIALQGAHLFSWQPTQCQERLCHRERVGSLSAVSDGLDRSGCRLRVGNAPRKEGIGL